MKRFLKPIGLSIAILALLASVVAGREKPSITILDHAAAQNIDLSRVERAAPGTAPAADPFAPKNFTPQPEQQQAAQAKPEAPALPFRYLGKLIEGGKLSVFLANGAETVTAKSGERIADWRVDKVTENEVQFTYLPLKTKQSLPL